jgi:hypothetical protein
MFLYDESNLRLAAAWINEGKILIDGLELGMPLTADQKYGILKTIHASKFFTLEEKQALLKKGLENDNSDKAHHTTKICESIYPDAALKEKLWKELTDLEAKDSVMDYQIKLSGFWSRYQ